MSSDKDNIFMKIRKAKAETAKEILSTFGAPYNKMNTILTADELVKFFDFFDLSTELHDYDELEEALLRDYGNTCIQKNLLSPESIDRIRKEVDKDLILFDE